MFFVLNQQKLLPFFPSGHLRCPPPPSPLPTRSLGATGARFGFPFLAAASCGGLGLVERVSGLIPPQVGCKPFQIHLGSSLSPLGCLGATAACCTAYAKPSLGPSAGSSLPGWACHPCRVKNLGAMLGHICHQPGPLLWLCIHPLGSVSANICGSGLAGKSNILGEPRALRWHG